MDTAYLTNEVLMLAAVVTSYVGVIKGYGVNKKHNHLIALLIAAIFVLVPTNIKEILTLVSVIGLTASGAYNFSTTSKTDKDKK
ncbi:hypothetical protein [Paenibacillus sp. NPDC093718]|uniref:hypothetical protein n=1 Tax=Paenibacillus sp. NPDC093718 TaxID=3390601 RepID=UPI003CFCA60B